MRTRKNQTLHLAGFLLSLAVLSSGCSTGGGDDVRPDAPERPIRLSAGLQAVTRSVVGTGSTFTAAVGGWESDATVDYTQPASWLSTTTLTASADAADIALTPERFYSQDGGVKTYIQAWYPGGTLSEGKVAFAGDADYKGDGTDDILFASEVSGSALDFATRTLTFVHLTSQVKFTVEGDELFGEHTTLRGIVIRNTSAPTGFDVTDGSLVYDPTATLTVPGIDGTQIISPTVAFSGVPVMIPSFAQNRFSVDVHTFDEATSIDVVYRDIPVTLRGDTRMVPGKAYTIALTFAGYAVSAQASVAEWDYTGTGSGDVTADY